MFDPRVLTRAGTVLLDTARTSPENRRSLCFTSPVKTLVAERPGEVPSLLEEMETATEAGKYVAGYLAYEAGYPFVDLETPDVDEPLAWFGVYNRVHSLAPPEVSLGLSRLSGCGSAENVTLGVSREEYIEAVEQIRHHIREGDVYQINYTAPVRFRTEGDPRLLYRRLRQRQHVSYGAYLNLGPRQILSCSPELFLRRTGEEVQTRPMKGTIRRGRTLEEDRELRKTLVTDPKNRAENLMIVDLLRNDLSVCCRPGSVEVSELFAIETYDTVIQMTSAVEGRLQSGAGIARLLRALFPCGSVTGAPKRRAMRLIRRLEPAARGVYCGAIGMVGPDDSAVFSVPIRTAVIQEGQGTMGVGSGIVWDSDPEAEYEEWNVKTQFLKTSTSRPQTQSNDDDLRLIETMRFDGVRLPLLDRHVERLRRSATYFGYPFSPSRFRRRIKTVLSGRDMNTVLKVRATLDRWGRIEVETTPLTDEVDEPWTLVVASERVDRQDPLFYHKTTHRGVYDRALGAARAAGADEALLLNGEGEVTEGAHSNIFIRQGDALWTPPTTSGLLAGVYRDYVLETQETAEERRFGLDDIGEADGVYCCNAVRGWCEAVLSSTTRPSNV